jgi:trimeric autotransporter adhesin
MSAGCAVALLALTPTGAGAASGGTSVSAVAGTGAFGYSGDGGPAGRAELAGPTGIAVDGAGDIAVADTGNCRVEMIAARAGRHFGIEMRARHIYTVAGTGCSRGGAKRATPMPVSDPTGVAFDKAGDLLIADGDGNRILELPVTAGRDYGVALKAGRLTAVAGTGVAGTAVPGRSARLSPLDDPQGVAVDAAGDLFIAETAACEVVEIPSHDETRLGTPLSGGHLSIVAGTGVCGFSGDGGRATAAELWAPSAVTLDGAGDLLIADEGNSAVREVPVAAGTFYGVTIGAGDIGTVAGQDMYTTYLNDGLGATGPVADVNYPTGLAVDGAGDLFIADSYDQSIREVPAHASVLFGRSVDADDMYTLVGVLAVGGAAAGDGTRWIATHVTYPYGVALGPGGSLDFTDQGANRVRRITAP